MRIFQSIALAVMLAFAALGSVQAQTTECMSAQTLIEKANEGIAADQKLDLIYLTGEALETFATNMDKITGGGHSAMDGLVFVNPDDNKNDMTVIAIFRDSCYIGNAEVLTSYVKQALGPQV